MVVKKIIHFQPCVKKMFGFEKLQVYQKAREFNLEIRRDVLSNEKLDRVSRDQLRRAEMSIMLNIAEGTVVSAMLVNEIFM